MEWNQEGNKDLELHNKSSYVSHKSAEQLLFNKKIHVPAKPATQNSSAILGRTHLTIEK